MSKRWREKCGVIYLNVTSDGTSGKAWIKYFEEQDCCVDDDAKSVLCSKNFTPTNGVTWKIAILKGVLFSDTKLITMNIRTKASGLKFTTLNAEAVCLIRKNFTDEELKEMGLSYIVAIESIKDFDGYLYCLAASSGDLGCWFGVCSDTPDRGWYRGGGFAFDRSQVP